MPYLHNISNAVTGIDSRVASVRFWPYNNAQQRIELANTVTALQTCRFVEFEGYDARQQGNTSPLAPPEASLGA